MTIGAAIRTALKRQDMTQKLLAEALDIDQGTVSRWVNDDPRYSLRLGQIGQIEEALGLRRGWLLIAAGYVEDVLTVEDAILADPGLDKRGRSSLLASYRSLVVE